MLLFVRRIPESIGRKELERFVEQANDGFWRRLPFVKKPKIEKCEIIRIEDIETDSVEYHGLITIQPATEAVKLIEKLNGATLRGRQVEVRKYFRRSNYKDRRQRHVDLEALPRERRMNDRRRAKLKIRTVRSLQIEYEGLGDHSRINL